MAHDSLGTHNEPQYAATGVPADAADLTEVAAYAVKVGNAKVGTTTQRNALTGADLWDGLLFSNTDLDSLDRYNGSGWVTVLQPSTAWTPTVANVSTSAVVAKYTIASGRVSASVKITISAAPTNAPTVTLPVAADLTSTVAGSGAIRHGASFIGDTFALLTNSTTIIVYPKFTSGSPAYVQAGLTVNSTLPITWAAGDTIELSLSYMAA